MIFKSFGTWFFLFPLIYINSAGATTASDSRHHCNLLDDKYFERLKNIPVHYYKLDNGLQILVQASDRLPVVATRIVYSVGARDESAGQSGYAHLFEHMMFKGSDNVPDGGHFSAINSIGGKANASTDYDKTVYWNQVPGNYLDRVLWLEADRLRSLAINSENLDNQRQAVLEEKSLRLDNVPYFRVASEFLVDNWQGTSYDHLIIGSEQDLNNATVDSAEQFFKQYYTPANAILTIVGDVDHASVINKVKLYFSDITAGSNNDKTPRHFIKPRLNEQRMHDPLAPFPLYALAWHTPGFNHPDHYAVEILNDILLHNDASRLKRLLKEEEQLVFELFGLPYAFEYVGLANMAFIPHSYTSFDDIKRIVKSQLEAIRSKGVESVELCSAIKHRQMQILDTMATHKGLAGLISNGLLFHNNPHQFVNDLKAYQQISNHEIKNVARKYFNDDWLALEITPGPAVRMLKKLMEILPRGFSKSLENLAL